MRAPDADEQAQKLRARELLEGDRAAALLRQPFVAMLALQLEVVPVVDDRLELATTDGQKLFVSAPALLELGVEQRVFLLAHLTWHAALSHPTRWEGVRGRVRDIVWDLAVDHEVNAILADLGVVVPEDAALVPARGGASAEQLAMELSERRSWALPYLRAGRGALRDLHLDLRGQPIIDGLDEARERAGWDDHSDDHSDDDEAEGDEGDEGIRDPDFVPGPTGDARQWTERLLATAQQLERRTGALPERLRRLIEELRQPQLPWPKLLARYVVSVIGGQRVWLPPSRRHVHSGLYLPSHRDRLLRLTAALDTSASTQRVMGTFLGELSGIVSAYGRYELTLLACDDAVESLGRFGPDRPLDVSALDLQGLGSTDLRPIFDAVSEQHPRPALLVMLTDGFGEAPERDPGYPVLWALTRGGRRPAAWGQVVRLG